MPKLSEFPKRKREPLVQQFEQLIESLCAVYTCKQAIGRTIFDFCGGICYAELAEHITSAANNLAAAKAENHYALDSKLILTAIDRLLAGLTHDLSRLTNTQLASLIIELETEQTPEQRADPNCRHPLLEAAIRELHESLGCSS